MKTLIFTLATIFALLVFFGCRGQAASVITQNVTDRPLLVFPLIKRHTASVITQNVTDRPLLVFPLIKRHDWDKELEKGLVHFESFKSRPYYCCAGVHTIGYGCTDKSVIQKGWISEKEARALLLKEVDKVKAKVREEVTVKLSDNQLNALTSFAFNCGMTNLRKLVNGKDRLNSGNYESVEKILPLYRRAGGKVRKGLERRRAWELALWKGEI